MTDDRNVYTRAFEGAELDCKQTRSSLFVVIIGSARYGKSRRNVVKGVSRVQ